MSALNYETFYIMFVLIVNYWRKLSLVRYVHKTNLHYKRSIFNVRVMIQLGETLISYRKENLHGKLMRSSYKKFDS